MNGAFEPESLRAAVSIRALSSCEFPVEQRYAIYVPLFLPVFVHRYRFFFGNFKAVSVPTQRHVVTGSLGVFSVLLDDDCY